MTAHCCTEGDKGHMENVVQSYGSKLWKLFVPLISEIKVRCFWKWFCSSSAVYRPLGFWVEPKLGAVDLHLQPASDHTERRCLILELWMWGVWRRTHHIGFPSQVKTEHVKTLGLTSGPALWVRGLRRNSLALSMRCSNGSTKNSSLVVSRIIC